MSLVVLVVGSATLVTALWLVASAWWISPTRFPRWWFPLFFLNIGFSGLLFVSALYAAASIMGELQ